MKCAIEVKLPRLVYLQPNVCVCVLCDLLTQFSVSSWCPSDHRGTDPGEGLCAALPPGSLPQPVARRLPQHEEDGEPPAPLGGAGRRQGQDPPPATGTVSAAASPTLWPMEGAVESLVL